MLSLGIPQGPPGQDGVQLNDDAVNTTEAWSSKKIVDTLCPAFSVSGNPVTCNPVEGYPLGAVVTLKLKQAGSGDPSPDNVRPISGYDSVTVTQSKDEAQVKQITLTLPETIYGGTVDAVTGVGEKTWHNLVLTGDESWKLVESNLICYNLVDLKATHTGICSHLPYKRDAVGNGIYLINTGAFASVAVGSEVSKNYTVESWSQYLKSQFNSGTPVTIAYQLATPEPFQAAGNQALPAVAGLNTVYTDGDSLDVTGRQDLLYTLQSMQTQTQNLNRFIAEGGTR